MRRYGGESSSPPLGLLCSQVDYGHTQAEPYEPMWINVLGGLALITYALRPKLTLHEDAVHIRGLVLSRIIPVEEISAIEGGYGGAGHPVG